MATVKIKFRVSSIETKAGTLYYQVIHNNTFILETTLFDW